MLLFFVALCPAQLGAAPPPRCAPGPRAPLLTRLPPEAQRAIPRTDRRRPRLVAGPAQQHPGAQLPRTRMLLFFVALCPAQLGAAPPPRCAPGPRAPPLTRLPPEAQRAIPWTDRRRPRLVAGPAQQHPGAQLPRTRMLLFFVALCPAQLGAAP